MSQSNVITGSDSTPVYRVRKIGPGTSRTLWPKVSLISRRNLRTLFLGLIYPLVGIGLVVGARFILFGASRHRDCQTCSAV